MFTHQDPEVWADVGLTLWSAGFRLPRPGPSSPKPTSSGLKGGGNYVQGTVNLVLRKRIGNKRATSATSSPRSRTRSGARSRRCRTLDDLDDPTLATPTTSSPPTLPRCACSPVTPRSTRSTSSASCGARVLEVRSLRSRDSSARRCASPPTISCRRGWTGHLAQTCVRRSGCT